MKRFLSLCVVLLATIWLWAGNVITYTAPSKQESINVNAFNVPISSHSFYNGTGRIWFDNEAVTVIGSSAFSECYELTSVTIPNGVTSIGNSAFSGCYSLTSVSVPNSLTSIGDYAFYQCYALTSITIPNSVVSIGKYAFHMCRSLAPVNIPEGITSIANYTFYGCENFSSITIPESVMSIGDYAFAYCAAGMMPGAANQGTGLTSITIPNSVVNIGKGAFSNCADLISITIPNSVTSIGERAFQNCYSLTSVTIGNNVMSIGDYAFDSCDDLTTITCEAINPPTVYSRTFYSVRIPVYVPCGSLAAYQSAQYWSNFTNIQTEGDCEYTRSTTPGRYGTICLPKGVAHDDIEGGVFFNIVYAVTNTNMDITGILMEEETGDLVAGKPYIFRATADELVLPYTGEAVANPLAANGLVGNLSETPLDVPQGMYVLSNNQIRKLNGGTATAGQNRAYLDLTNVTKLNYVPSAAPNRVMLNAEGSSEATDLENLQSKDVQKVIRDGQLLIIRDGKIYNVLGMTL